MTSASTTTQPTSNTVGQGGCAMASTTADGNESTAEGDSGCSSSSSSSAPADDSQPPQCCSHHTAPSSNRAIEVEVLLTDDVAGRVSECSEDVDLVEAAVRAALRVVGIAGGEVVVQVVDDAQMTALHRQFCNLDSTTDVLTFDRTVDESTTTTSPFAATSNLAERANRLRRSAIWVDLAICADEAARQANARGHSITREIILYAIHGILHCLGHDDHDPNAYDRMHEIEDEILEEIGVGRTFNMKSGNRCADSGSRDIDRV